MVLDGNPQKITSLTFDVQINRLARDERATGFSPPLELARDFRKIAPMPSRPAHLHGTRHFQRHVYFARFCAGLVNRHRLRGLRFGPLPVDTVRGKSGHGRGHINLGVLIK